MTSKENMIKTIRIRIIALALTAITSACTDFRENEAIPTGITLDVEELSFAEKAGGQTVTITSGSKWTVYEKPEWITVQSVDSQRASIYEWHVTLLVSSNESYNREGSIVFQAGNETTTLPVSQQGSKGESVAVESVSISPTELTMTEGDTQALTATVLPSNASDKSGTWFSNDESVAIVSSGGVVTAKAVGSAIITVKTNDGSKTAACLITVVSHSYEYVDLELPSGLKWATCNLGASKPEEYGDYYAWGETETKTDYAWSSYEWCNWDGSQYSLTKYCTESSYGIVDNKTVLEMSDDVAHVKLGGSWWMPTDGEWTELRENCSWSWATLNGVKGMLVTSKKNGTNIFLPAAGKKGEIETYDGYGGYYWSSSLYEFDNSYKARIVSFSDSGVFRYSEQRLIGQSIRPVSE